MPATAEPNRADRAGRTDGEETLSSGGGKPRRLLPPAALMLLVAAVAGAAGMSAGLVLVRGWNGGALALPEAGDGAWSSALSGLVASSPVLAPLLALLLAALVAPRFREAAIVRRTRELAEQVEARTRELARANAELDRLAHLDPLTLVANRRVFDRELLHLRENGGRIGLLLVDVDRFKSINDRFGHAVGDLVLRAVAGSLSEAAEPRGQVARLGGDEFALLTPLAGDENPADVALRIVAALERHRLDVPGLEVTLSLGWALAEPGDSKAALFLCADAALYRAKRGGGEGRSGGFPVLASSSGALSRTLPPDPLSDTAELALHRAGPGGPAVPSDDRAGAVGGERHEPRSRG